MEDSVSYKIKRHLFQLFVEINNMSVSFVQIFHLTKAHSVGKFLCRPNKNEGLLLSMHFRKMGKATSTPINRLPFLIRLAISTQALFCHNSFYNVGSIAGNYARQADLDN